jgi:hypothetical protein
MLSRGHTDESDAFRCGYLIEPCVSKTHNHLFAIYSFWQGTYFGHS